MFFLIEKIDYIIYYDKLNFINGSSNTSKYVLFTQSRNEY